MLDINTIEQLDKIATPFYYYDMDLFHKTVDHVAELVSAYDIKVHYAINERPTDNGVVMLEVAHNVVVRVDISVIYPNQAEVQQQGN